MSLRPQAPLDDSWLFADPMTINVVEDEHSPQCTLARGGDSSPSTAATPAPAANEKDQ